MEYKTAYIKLYGAYAAAIEEIDQLNFGRCKEILNAAIAAAEEIALEIPEQSEGE